MKVIRAKVLGFCMGVRRAVDTVNLAISSNSSNKKIYTLGPLIHNPLLMNNLKNQGVEVLDFKDLSKVDENSVVIIRAHGTTTTVLNDLENKNCILHNATCPRVLLSQKKVQEWSNKGYFTILVGDKNHGEVTSIASYANNNFIVIESLEEAKKLELPEKVFLLSQTTFSPKEFAEISQYLKEKKSDLEIFDSICNATIERQNSLKELENQVDGILIIGGKNSANTRRLYEKAKELFSKAVLIEDENEIPEEFFAMNSVGITAGASTPDFVINKVENCLLNKN